MTTLALADRLGGGSKRIADSYKPPVKDAQKVILTKEKRTHKTGA